MTRTISSHSTEFFRAFSACKRSATRNLGSRDVNVIQLWHDERQAYVFTWAIPGWNHKQAYPESWIVARKRRGLWYDLEEQTVG